MLLSMALLIPVGGINIKSEENKDFRFDDVQDNSKSFYEPVYWAVENSITTGTSKNPPLFSPFKTCTRAQFVTFLWRLEGKPKPATKKNPFTDVASGLSYSDAVLWALENNITTGTSDTTFSPGKDCTRAQVVTFLWRAKNKPEPKTTKNPFTDVASGLSYSKAVLWAYENQITTGTSDTAFSPGKSCTRAQTVTFLYRTEHNISKYEDALFIPSFEDAEYDSDAYEIYFKNLLDVYTLSKLSDKEAEKLAAVVDGEIISKLSGAVNLIQLRVNGGTLSGLEALADKLMKEDNVLYADIEYPLSVDNSAADSNPWSSDPNNPDSDRGNDNNPGGNDWWAEAIGAYSAWENYEMKNPVNIGVIDHGFQTDHPELAGKIQFLPDYADNTPQNHGTHVAGIIAASNNNIGIRGIADKASLYCTSYVQNQKSHIDAKLFMPLTAGFVMDTSEKMISSSVKVINNSWGLKFYSESEYTTQISEDHGDVIFLFQWLYVHNSGIYDDYVKYMANAQKRSARNCTINIIEFLLNGYSDFLIVQSAGNGLNNGGKGIDCHNTGFYAAIDESIYNSVLDGMSEKRKKQLSDKGITYNSIKDRIMIVGAVKNTQNDDGDYEMTGFSDFGDNVDICAPGEDIFSTVTNSSYAKDNGTSMAAPMVSASAAYCWSLNPKLTAPEVKDMLLRNHACDAYGVGDGSSKSYPMLNIGLAAKAAYESSRKYLEIDKKLKGLWAPSGNYNKGIYDFDIGKMTYYDMQDFGTSITDTPFKKEKTETYTIEKESNSTLGDYKIIRENGTTYYLKEEFPTILSLLWYDEKGILHESLSGSLLKKEGYTIDDLTIQE